MASILAISEQLTAIALAFLRLAPLLLVPVISPAAILPSTVRIFITAMVAVIAVHLHGPGASVASGGLVAAIAHAPLELALGVAMALGYQATVAALMTIGRVMDLQMGFGAAGILNPGTNNAESLLGTILMWLMLFIAVEVGLHYDIVAALMLSFAVFPVGSVLPAASPEIFLLLFGEQFMLALLLALPVIALLMLFDVLIGLAAKGMPQMNVYFITLPLKIFIGIIAVWATAQTIGNGIVGLIDNLRAYWLNLLVV